MAPTAGGWSNSSGSGGRAPPGFDSLFHDAQFVGRLGRSGGTVDDGAVGHAERAPVPRAAKTAVDVVAVLERSAEVAAAGEQRRRFTAVDRGQWRAVEVGERRTVVLERALHVERGPVVAGRSIN